MTVKQIEDSAHITEDGNMFYRTPIATITRDAFNELCDMARNWEQYQETQERLEEYEKKQWEQECKEAAEFARRNPDHPIVKQLAKDIFGPRFVRMKSDNTPLFSTEHPLSFQKEKSNGTD